MMVGFNSSTEIDWFPPTLHQSKIHLPVRSLTDQKEDSPDQRLQTRYEPYAYSERLDCSTGTPGPIVEDTEIFLR